MTAREALVEEFSKIVTEQLIETNTLGSVENCITLVSEWCDNYDNYPPVNRAEVAVRDALEELRVRYISKLNTLQA